MNFKTVLLSAFLCLTFVSNTYADLLDDELFGFEGPIFIDNDPLTPKNWFIDQNASMFFEIVDSRSNGGFRSLKFTHQSGVENNTTVFSPPGSVNLPIGEFVLSMDVYVEPGSSVGRVRPILESPFQFITPINLSKLPQGQWVTVTSDKFTRAEVSGEFLDRLRLQLREGDLAEGAGTFYIDNINIKAFDEVNTPAFPVPFTNELDTTLAGFEPQASDDWFIIDNSNGFFGIVDKNINPDVNTSDGNGALLLNTQSTPTANTTAFSPFGSLETLSGEFSVSLDVYIEPDSSVQQIRTILENPFQQGPNFDVSKTVQGQWVRLTSAPFARPRASGNNDRIRIQFRTEDFSNGPTRLSIDNVAIQEYNPRIRNVTGFAVTPSNTTIFVDRQTQLSGEFIPQNPTNQTVIWSSADENIAMVDDTGLVTGISEGSTQVIAVTEDGGFVSTVQIQVREYENLVQDSDFEDNTFDAWSGLIGNGFIVNNANNVYSGDRALRLSNTTNQDGSVNVAYIEQVINIEPNTRYVASLWGRLVPNNRSGIFGVKDYGGVTLTSNMSGPRYTQYSLTFKSGPDATSVTIFVQNQDANNLFIDEVELLEVPEIIDVYDPAFYDLQETTYIGPIDEGVYQSLLIRVNDARDALFAKMVEAENNGIDTSYAQVTLTTLDLFKNKFVPFDKDNLAAIEERYDRIFFAALDPVGPEALPFDQLADSLLIAERAIDQLQQQIDGNLSLVSPPDLSISKVTVDGSNYVFEGQPVFATKFFFQPDDEEVLKAFGRHGEKYISVQDLADADTIRDTRRNAYIRDIERIVDQKQSPIQFFVGHIVPNNSPLRDIDPSAFGPGIRKFTDYDMDNPSVRSWLNTLFDKLVGENLEVFDDTERVYMLSNEPTFGFREGGAHSDDGISEITLAKYADWLANKYGTIEALNIAYNINVDSFDEVHDVFPTPLALNLQGGAVWYDWHIFNMERVNEWFTFLDQSVRAADPNALTHIKVLGERSIHGIYADEGIDFEYVTKLVDVPGSDNQMTPLKAQYSNRIEDSWKEDYALEWRAQSIMLDFMKSISPEKPIFDSEWHALSGSRWRDFNMTPEYVRASMWLAVTHGVDAMNAWVWNRRDDGSVDTRADFVGTTVTQPIQLDAFGRTVQEINAHRQVAMKLEPQDRNVLLYYSKDSAIQDPTYTTMLSEVYEAARISNLSVGFTTPTELKNVNKAKQVVVLPPTQFVSKNDLAQLVAFSRSGGKVVKILQSQSLAKDEVGNILPPGLIAGLRVFKEVNFDSVFSMADMLNIALENALPQRSVQIEMINQNGNANYGVLASLFDDKASGSTFVSLINVSQDPIEVSLQGTDGEPDAIVDLIKNQSTSNSLILAPMDVQLLEIKNNLGQNIPALVGDLDGDNDIDIFDIRIFLRAIATGEVLPLELDLNNDGAIDRLDSIVLRQRCTRARCAV